MSRKNYGRHCGGGGRGTLVTLRSHSLDHDIAEIERGRTLGPLETDEQRARKARSKVTLSPLLDDWLKKDVP